MFFIKCNMAKKERKFAREFFRGCYVEYRGNKEPFIMYSNGRDHSGKTFGDILDCYGLAFFEGFIDNQIMNFEKKYEYSSRSRTKVPIKYTLKKTNTGIYYGEYSFKQDDWITSGKVIIRKINLKNEVKKTIEKDLKGLSEMSSFPRDLAEYLIIRKRTIYNKRKGNVL